MTDLKHSPQPQTAEALLAKYDLEGMITQGQSAIQNMIDTLGNSNALLEEIRTHYEPSERVTMGEVELLPE